VKTEEREHLIKILRETIYNLTGNYYPDERMKILEYKIERLLRSVHLDSAPPKRIINYFLLSPDGKKMLIDLMTVPETRFFREYEQLTALMGGPCKNKNNLTVLSIGCSTGEEPYSVAMIMKRTGKTGKVVGTDINENVLEKARKGLYRASSLRDVPEEYREFFIEKDGQIEVVDEIRRMVSFRPLNLINRQDFLSLSITADCVLCRNVLIYFDSKSKRVALENIREILVKDGLLVLSSTEILQREFYDIFEPIKEGKFFFYKPKG